MKIKLIQAGYENFTGEMGHIAFVDGVSEDINPDFARSLGGIIEVEDVSDAADLVVIDDTDPAQSDATLPE